MSRISCPSVRATEVIRKAERWGRRREAGMARLLRWDASFYRSAITTKEGEPKQKLSSRNN